MGKFPCFFNQPLTLGPSRLKPNALSLTLWDEIFVFTFRVYLQIDEKTSEIIWRPSIKFENLLKYEKTKSFGDQSLNIFWLWGNESQNLDYSEEFQLTFPCRFHLSKFPFDSHECPIYFEDERAYGTWELTITDVTIHYRSSQQSLTTIGYDPLILDDLALPFGIELEVLPIREEDTGINYSVSQAGMLIRIKRDSLGQLMSGYYYPTTSFALLSMISFLINPDVVRQVFEFASSLFSTVFLYLPNIFIHITIGSW